MKFNTLEEATELFRGVNGLGSDNCIFTIYKDPNVDAAKYAMFGAVGAAISAGINSGKDRGLEQEQALLVNQTESGLGIIPLKTKAQMIINVSKMEPQLDKYIFIPNDSIESVTIKNFNIFNKKIQKVHIQITGMNLLREVGKVKDKDIEYQEANFARFMSRYKK